MTDILSHPLVREYLRAATELYRKGWAERNGGNLSMILDCDFHELPVKASFPLAFGPGLMTGRYLLITGSGKYLKNVEPFPEDSLALLRIQEDRAELLWGLSGGGRPSSELAAHILSHNTRLAADPTHRVVMHTHATNLVALSCIHPLEDRLLTKTLWSMLTECLMFFPDGLAVLPWLPCGTPEIGAATAEKMRDCRLVLWAQHGAFSAGASPDDALGLLEIADKAAQLYVMTAHLPILSRISEAQLRQLAETLNIRPREGWL
jgi:rhamnulose-1-phosphate aldolase